jgi:hypothetical protein
LVGFLKIVMGLSLRKMPVIMILMDHIQGRGQINYLPVFLHGVENHPVIPSCPSHCKWRDLVKLLPGKNKKIDCGEFPAAPLFFETVPQGISPTWFEIDRVGYIKIPAFPNQQVLLNQPINPPNHLQRIRQKDDVCIDIKQELSRRKRILEWMLEKEIFDYKDVARVVSSYYSNPGALIDMISGG